MELVLAVEQCGIEIIEALAMAFLLLLGHLTAVVPKADPVAEHAQIDRVLHLLQVLEIEDVTLGVQTGSHLVADCAVRVFLHYINIRTMPTSSVKQQNNHFILYFSTKKWEVERENINSGFFE